MLLVNYGLERRFRTSEYKSCSSSKSRITTEICIDGMEGCVFIVDEGCVFTGGEGCVFAVCGIGFGV